MRLLAIDTATPQVSVAVWAEGHVVASRKAAEDRRHGELLAPAIHAVVAEAGMAVADLDAVGVDVGPGLFTGLRVGVATAKALASALARPVVAVTSLEVLAHGAGPETRVIAAVVDARRHEVFRALYRAGADGPVETHEPAVLAPAELADELQRLDAGVLVVGDGGLRYRDQLAGPHVEVAGPDAGFPDAAVAARLAAARLAAGEVTDAIGLRALYLRQADVKIGWARFDDAPAGSPHPAPAEQESGRLATASQDRRPPARRAEGQRG